MNRVLIIADCADICTASEVLTRYEFEIITARSADSAGELIKQEPVDVVAADWGMPGLSRWLAGQAPWDIPLILISEEPLPDSAYDEIPGIYDRLPKPVRPADLLKAVDKAAQYRALLNEKRQYEKIHMQYELILKKMMSTRLRTYQHALQDMIGVISGLTQMRDPYTAAHQYRVGNLAMAIAQEMGVSSFGQDGLRIMGYLHDIGKVMVPTSILSKSGKLRSYEFEIVKAHAECGYNILEQVVFPWPVAQAIYQHHERLDGSGYPLGLRGDAILFEARIIMAADTVEAMSSHRPYRPALGLDAALAEINKNRGVKYDEKVASACLSLFRKGYRLSDEPEPPFGGCAGGGAAYSRHSDNLKELDLFINR